MARKRRIGITPIKPSGAANLSDVATRWVNYGWTEWGFELQHRDGDKEDLWRAVGHDFNDAWAAVHPGLRCFAFWCYGPLPEPRRILAIATPGHAVGFMCSAPSAGEARSRLRRTVAIGGSRRARRS